MDNSYIELDKNIIKISGYITFENIVDILDTSIKKTNHLTNIKVDLKNLHSSNSSVLIFIINYMKNSIKKKQAIKFINIPASLIELSNVYNLNNIIQK